MLASQSFGSQAESHQDVSSCVCTCWGGQCLYTVGGASDSARRYISMRSGEHARALGATLFRGAVCLDGVFRNVLGWASARSGVLGRGHFLYAPSAGDATVYALSVYTRYVGVFACGTYVFDGICITGMCTSRMHSIFQRPSPHDACQVYAPPF